MSILESLQNDGVRVVAQRAVPRVWVDDDGWRRTINHLRAGELTLLSLWAEASQVHMALLQPDDHGILILTLPCPSGRYP